MSRFDDLMDDIIFKAKSAADIAGRKTSEVVELGKLKYQAKQVTWEIEKTYSKLGAIVYESKKSTENFDDIIALAVEELDSLNAQLEELEQKILESKNDFNDFTPPTASATAEEPVEESAPEPDAAPQEAPREEE